MNFKKRFYRRDMVRCLLCADAPCTAACPSMDPAALLRSVWFDNESGAAAALGDVPVCSDCAAVCETACLRPGEVPIRRILTGLHAKIRPALENVPIGEARLRTELCGVELENPFLLSSSVVASTYDMCARAFDAGWAGASFKTICAFDIHEASPRYAAIAGEGGALVGFKNIEQLSSHSVAEDMAIFRELKKNYPRKVILASIMGRDDTEWASLAGECERSGADAVELNFSCPNMSDEGLGSDIGQDPALVERFTAAAKSGCSIPVLVKLTPNVASPVGAALAAMRGGADGISAINTIKSIVNVNLYTYVSAPAVRGMSAVGGYSGSAVKPIALRMIAELGWEKALSRLHLSGIGGIETWRDAMEFILLGCSSVQVTTAVMQYGYRIIDDLKSGMARYLAEGGFSDISEIRGAALSSVSASTNALERDTVIYPEYDRSLCVGCGRCVISCADGGHQAVRLNDRRRPVLDPARCVGCHLCALVCPVGAVGTGGKRRAPVRKG